VDARAHERPGQVVHGLVKAFMKRLAGAVLLLLLGVALASGIAGGLARGGISLPLARDAAWFGPAVADHAALIICAFMGTVIAAERAVALRRRWAWLAPGACALAGAALLAGEPAAARGLLLAASACFAAVNIALVCKQRAGHTVLLLASALAWLAGNTLFAAGLAGAWVLPWWFAFLLVTIAAERLEMTRLTRRRPGAQRSLLSVLTLMALGAALSGPAPTVGGALYGASLLLLALWLLVFDIARRTVRAEGLPRYMAVCLLGGYLWLAVAGVAWAATAWGAPTRDIALHALGLGFIVSMMMGHAPVILPAVAGVKLLYGAWFYLPLAALHLSLALRFAPAGRADGALFNTFAIALFAATVAGAALAWRRRHQRARTTIQTS